MNNKLNKINKYLQDTYKTNRIKVNKNNSKNFEYMILFDDVCIDELNSLDTYDINNSIYYYFTGDQELSDENELIKINKKELKKWNKIY